MYSILLRNTGCAMRGPLGQQLPRGLISSQRSLFTQIAKMSPASALMSNKMQRNTLTPESLMKVQVRNSHGNHVTLWTAERALSAVMVPLIPLAFAVPSPTLDYLLAFTFALHSHWGIEAIVVDYVRPSVFGETIPKIAVAAVYGLSALTLGGLIYFVYADVGIVNAIKLLWKL